MNQSNKFLTYYLSNWRRRGKRSGANVGPTFGCVCPRFNDVYGCTDYIFNTVCGISSIVT